MLNPRSGSWHRNTRLTKPPTRNDLLRRQRGLQRHLEELGLRAEAIAARNIADGLAALQERSR